MQYDTKERFCSYWHQINEVQTLKPLHILEIGKGNGFVSTYLKNNGYKMCSLDLEYLLKPEVAGSVLNIPFKNESFDVVICCEVLEHIPFENFQKGLMEVNRVAKNNAIVSLPDLSPAWKYIITVPRLGEFNFLIPKPRFRAVKFTFNGEHYWNISNRGFPLKKIVNLIKLSGFHIVKQYRVFEMPWHRFFILAKTNAI
jgi:ubiquinone/menaquinone biosynthesis C-methylase UbiE